MSVIQLNFVSTVSLVRMRVKCCILTGCSGFQFSLQFVTFNLLLQYDCHSADCQMYFQSGSAEQFIALYRLCVVAFILHYSL